MTAAVLAGGRSMRMGVDKTLLDVDGQSLIARDVGAVGEVCANTVVVTNRPEALTDTDLPANVRIVQDEVAYQGPLGGLVTAMKEAPDDWVLAVAADMPHLEPGVIRALWAARDGGDVVVPVTEKGPEPLLALYRVATCAGPAREVLETGRRRLVAFFPRVKVVEIPVEQLREVDPELLSLVNINTPADLAEAREMATELAAPERARCELVSPRSMPSERQVTVYLNDVEVATMQASPTELEELGVGFLVAEGLLVHRHALLGIDVDAKRGLVWVTSEESVPEDLTSRQRYLTSGCGKGVTFASLGHARGLEPVVSSRKRFRGEGWKDICLPTGFATPSPPTSWSRAPIFGPFRRCSGMPRSRRRNAMQG